MGKDLGYDIVYRDASHYYIEGRRVFFQRPKECGGGYWLGRTWDFVFMFEIEKPVSLREGVDYIITASSVEAVADEFDDDQLGLPF